MSKLIIGVDVDLTIVDTLTPWLEWFEWHTGIKFEPDEESSYDLVPEMKRLAVEAGYPKFDPFAYWCQPGLYDCLKPIEGSIETLSILVEDYDVEICFISKCVPSHERSKRSFLERYFPKEKFGSTFVSTSDKGIIAYDILIDDNLEVLGEAMKRRPYSEYVSFRALNRWGDMVRVQHTIYDWSSEESFNVLMRACEYALLRK